MIIIIALKYYALDYYPGRYGFGKKIEALLRLNDRGFGTSGAQAVQSDFTVFRAHLAEACRKRKMSYDPLCAAAVDLHFAGVRALDIYRLAQIADDLDVSVDWLLGRSEMMELTKAKTKARPSWL